MEKVTVKTVELTGGSEMKIENLDGQNTVIINNSGEKLYASAFPDIEAGADNVIEIPAGARDGLNGTHGTVYLLGSGRVELRGTDYAVNFRQPSSSASSGGDGRDIFLNGIYYDDGYPTFPEFYRKTQVESGIPISYNTYDQKNYWLEFEKSWSINGAEDGYTDAAVITSEIEIDFSKYKKIIVWATPYKNRQMMSDVYFKIGTAAPSIPHTPYDFSDWTHLYTTRIISTDYNFYNNPQEALTFRIDVSDINTICPISFGITHGSQETGYSAYFSIFKIELQK